MRKMWRERTVGAVRLGKRAKGFTLLEVLVGAMLLLIAMAGLVPFFISGLSQSASVRYKSTANNIAREKMEEIRQYDYREIDEDLFQAPDFPDTEDVRGVTYTIDYEVVSSSYEEGVLKEVSVTVGWTAPPVVSPTRLTTMFHQQYVGPRISRMEVTDPDPVTDPLGTPFDCLQNGLTYQVYCHIAQADWGLVLDGTTPKTGVYMRLYLVNDDGISTPVGDAAAGYKITNLVPVITDGEVTDVYFQLGLDSATLDDGYFEFRAWAFNQYDEPGNVWRLRLRVENGGPDAPTDMVGSVIEGDQGVLLEWLPGSDTDRDHYVIQRRGRTYTGGVGWGLWGTWVTVSDAVVDDATEYSDDGGSIPAEKDPYGTSTKPRQYQYSIWAVDTVGNVGATYFMPEADWVVIPATAYVEPPESTTSTLYYAGDVYSIKFTSAINKKWTVEVTSTDADPAYSNTIAVEGKTTVYLDYLLPGHYHIRATADGVDTFETTTDLPLLPGWDPEVGEVVLTK